MAFENLTDKLTAVFKKLKSRGKLSETDVKNAMREVKLALLEADVNYKVVKDFIQKLSQRAVGQEVMQSLTPAQMVIKLVREELITLMGGTAQKLKYPSKAPLIIMMCGLQGSGKTTHCAKLALMLKNKGKRPLLVAGDIYRPAAIEQLQALSKKINVPVFEMGTENSPVVIAKKALAMAKDYGYDVVIIDTAGRLHIDQPLMEELKQIKIAVEPSEILLAVDAMTGQDAVNVAHNFDQEIGITGVVLTKTDGDARGGAAISVKAVTGKPIKFSGTGEKLEDIEVFHPQRMAERILGMGDILSLIEDAEQKIDQKQAKKLANKVSRNELDLNDLYEQFNQIKNMGSIRSIVSKIPGLNKKLKDVDLDDRQIDRTMAIILSMTKEEKQKPQIINASRKKRIAKGSGMKVEDVNKLLKQFDQMKKMMKMFSGKATKRRIKLPFSNMGFK